MCNTFTARVITFGSRQVYNQPGLSYNALHGTTTQPTTTAGTDTGVYPYSHRIPTWITLQRYFSTCTIAIQVKKSRIPILYAEPMVSAYRQPQRKCIRSLAVHDEHPLWMHAPETLHNAHLRATSHNLGVVSQRTSRWRTTRLTTTVQIRTSTLMLLHRHHQLAIMKARLICIMVLRAFPAL